MPYTTVTTVWITTEFIAFHEWPDAPPARSYLADRHRHKFFVRVEVSVGHEDREIEFHDLKDNVNAFIDLEMAGGNWPISMSCEMVAERILHFLETSYPQRRLYTVSVAEDNENGAIIRRGLL